MKKKNFLIINGPNLNMLGLREPEIYGPKTLTDIEKETEENITQKFSLNCTTTWYQSNIEGQIVDRINAVLLEDWDAVIINPGAYAHTSIAILDALKILKIPIIEVHLSNTHLRESFRQNKMTAKASKIIIEGAGSRGYLLAILSQMV